MSSMNVEPTTPPPPPMIGKIGPYTVFVTPPTPKPSPFPHSHPQSPLSYDSLPKKKGSPPPLPFQSAPPVLPPPMHYHTDSEASASAFFWNALAKVQNAHSSLDRHVAHWFGLNQSKYQWALDDYYETKEAVQVISMSVACNTCAACKTATFDQSNSGPRDFSLKFKELLQFALQDQVDAKSKDVSSKTQKIYVKKAYPAEASYVKIIE